MTLVHISATVWVLATLQLIGLSSALFARFSEGSPGQTAGQWIFLCCLALVGFGTMVALAMGPGYWLPSAGTLSLMILLATCDFSRCRESSLELRG